MSEPGRASAYGRAAILLALLPALLLAVQIVATAELSFLDDGVTVLAARGDLADSLRIHEYGRFRPGHGLFFWLLFRVMPDAPWNLAIGNALVTILIAFLVYRLSGFLSPARLSRVGAAWLATLNTAAVESACTLSKIDNEQLAAWLAALLFLLQPAPADRWRRFGHAAMFVGCCAIVAATKETGVLLLVPLVARPLLLRRSSVESPTWRWLLAILGAVPLVAAVAAVAHYSLRGGGYFRDHVMQGQNSTRLHVSELSRMDWALTTLIGVGLLAGLMLCFRGEPDRRAAARLLLLQLVVLIGFNATLESVHPYYLLIAAALAGILAGAGATAFAGTRWAAPVSVPVALLLCWSAIASWGAAQSLLVTSRFYGRLTAAVLEGRPSRIVLFHFGGLESRLEADLIWNRIAGLGAEVLVLNEEGGRSGLPVVSERGVRPGDWLIEQFGAEVNRSTPLRDTKFVWPQRLAMPAKRLPIRLLTEFEQSFPVVGGAPWRTLTVRGSLGWRISVVERRPDFVVEGLTYDYWMGSEATLWVRSRLASPVELELTAIRNSGEEPKPNRLLVEASEGLVVDCPEVDGRVNCTIPPAVYATAPSEKGWRRLILRAENSESPEQRGIGPDPRPLSFNFLRGYSSG